MAGASQVPFPGFFRQTVVGALAGLIVGLIVGGIGSRLVMRAIAVAAGPRAVGLITQNENVVGAITLEGTAGLVLFGGLLFGVGGGLLYVAVRRWLPGAPRWRGLIFGILLLVVFGSQVLEGNNPDFIRFGSPLLNIGLFATLFIVFGLVVVPLADRFDRSFPAPASSRRPVLIAYVVLTLMALLAFAGAARLSLEEGQELLTAPRLMLYGLAFLPTVEGPHRSILAKSDRAAITVLAYALLAVPIVLGLFLDVAAIMKILGRTALPLIR